MKKLSFDKVQSIEDVASVIQQYPDKMVGVDSEVSKYNYESLLHLSEEHVSRFLQFVHYVDDTFSSYGYYNFIGQKIVTILSGATYYREHYDRIQFLTDGELSVLAKFSSIDSNQDYANNLDMFSKEILTIISNKTDDFLLRDELMSYSYFSFLSGKNENDVKEDLTVFPLSNLVQEAFRLSRQKIEESGFSDGRRF